MLNRLRWASPLVNSGLHQGWSATRDEDGYGENVANVSDATSRDLQIESCASASTKEKVTNGHVARSGRNEGDCDDGGVSNKRPGNRQTE